MSGPLALMLGWTLGGEALAAEPVGADATRPTDTTQPADEIGPADAAPDPDANVPVIARAGLEVDTSAAGGAGPVLMSRLEELGNLELRRAEILPRRTAEDPVIRVRFELRGEEGETYAILSDVAVRGAVLEGSAREIVCTLCTEGEVVDRARSELLRLVPFVRARFRAARPAPPPAEPSPPPPPPERRLGARGKAGVGLLAGGTLAFGTGLGLALARPRPDPDQPLRQVDTRPAGYVVLGVGAAAIVSGAVLLILDRRQPPPKARLAPLTYPGTAGLQLVGRF